jgi:hypothetical protein
MATPCAPKVRDVFKGERAPPLLVVIRPACYVARMILYKYAGDSGLKILKDRRLKVTPPNEFNDPFEITPASKRARPLAEMVADVRQDSEYFRSVYDAMVVDGEYVGSFSRFLQDMPAAIAKHYSPYKRLSRQETIKRDLAALDDVSLHLGVLCLSKPRANIPMWSYYGNHHRGVAFGINVEKIGTGLPGKSGFVKYCKQRVRLNPFAAQEVAVLQRERVLFTKSREWQHEQEFRRAFRLCDLISETSPNDGKKIHFLPIWSDSIEEIILGCRVKPRLESAIREELVRRGRPFSHIRLLRCERHVSKFELNVVAAD